MVVEEEEEEEEEAEAGDKNEVLTEGGTEDVEEVPGALKGIPEVEAVLREGSTLLACLPEDEADSLSTALLKGAFSPLLQSSPS